MDCNAIDKMNETQMLHICAQQLLNTPPTIKDLTLDMSPFTEFNSTTVAVLLRLQSNVQRMGKRLSLENINDALMVQMRQLGAQHIFHIKTPLAQERVGRLRATMATILMRLI